MATTRLKLAALFLVAATCGFASAQPPHRPDAHGDPLPPHALARLGTLRWRHGAAITFVTHTPDGKHLLTDSEDGTLRLWDLASGAEVRRFVKPSRPAGSDNLFGFFALLRSVSYGTALAPNGRMVAAGSADGTITVWDMSTARALYTLKPSESTATAALVFSADNELLVSKDVNQTLRVWDVAQGKQLRKFAKKLPTQFGAFQIGAFTGAPIFLSDGAVVGSVDAKSNNGQLGMVLDRWDLVTGRQLPPIQISEGGNEFLAFGFSPDGKVLAAAAFQGDCRLVDLTTGKELRKLQGLNMLNFITQYAFTPDGTTLAGWCSDETIHLWDVASGKERRVINKPSGLNFMGVIIFGSTLPSNLQFSADGNQLIVGTSGCAVRRWEVASGKEVNPLTGHQDAVLTLALSPDGKTAISRGADRTIRVWDVASGKELRRFALPGDTSRVAISPDGGALATAGSDGALRTWDISTGKEVRKWQGGQTGFNALAYSADGKRLASRDAGLVIRVWDAATGKEQRQIGEKPNGNQGNGNNFLGNFPSSNLPGVRFSGDGAALATVPPVNDPRLAAFGVGQMGNANPTALRLWDVATGRLIRKFDDSKSAFTAFAYAPDGRILATADADGAVVLWEAIAGKVRLRLQAAGLGTLILPLLDSELQTQAAGLFNRFTALAFSPDGRFLAGADSNRVIRFWDAVSGEKIGTLAGHQGRIQTLIFAADGKRLISGSADTTALVWDVAHLLQGHRTRYLALEDGRVEGLWQALGGDDSARVYPAVLRLMGAPRQVMPVLRERVRPVPPPDPGQLAQMLTDLDSKQFAARQKAADDLEKLGELAAHPVQEALAAKPSLERQQRLERVRDRLVAATTLTAEQRQALRAVEVLERIGTPEARDVLRAVAGGAAGARLTRQAQAALERLGR